MQKFTKAVLRTSLLIPLAIASTACTHAPLRAPAEDSVPSDNLVTCGQSQAGTRLGAVNFRYCFTRPARGTTSKDVLYFLHGNGGNETSWDVQDHHAIEANWKKLGVEAPVIITVSFGSSWFLSQEEGLFSSSLFETFTESVIADVEGRLSAKVAHRYLMGESMGGFNASMLYFKAPRLFAKVALLCPAIFTFSPQAPDSEVQAYIERHKDYARVDLIEKWRAKTRKAFSTADLWQEHNPIALSGQATSASPPVFILSDDNDVFGFNEGAVALHDQLVQKQVNAEFHHVPGGAHCQQNAESIDALARFFTSAR